MGETFHTHVFFKNKITLDTDGCYEGNIIDLCGRVPESSYSTYDWGKKLQRRSDPCKE